jgi:hypothetical protein
MAAYFDTLSDEKSGYPSAIVDDSVKLVHALRKHLRLCNVYDGNTLLMTLCSIF